MVLYANCAAFSLNMHFGDLALLIRVGLGSNVMACSFVLLLTDT
jgi:hypothetical protein